ncbi:DUF4065 domain-containing protein [Paenibacillus vulneris]|uniref:Panacea domain-containing protein n=1 Tax=Paenibacillus vulneris TaxID=1133364 RepID=A0ABW3UXU4_9BACL
MIVSVFDVANYFLQKSDPNSERSITHLKLQKLVYYAQAWHLAIIGNSLFNEKIEAWVHGPVCPDLYSRYKIYGFGVIRPAKNQTTNIPKDTRDLLDEVWQVYGALSGVALESLTHKERPWQQARGNLSDFSPSNNVITNDSMRTYYRRLLEDKN